MQDRRDREAREPDGRQPVDARGRQARPDVEVHRGLLDAVVVGLGHGRGRLRAQSHLSQAVRVARDLGEGVVELRDPQRARAARGLMDEALIQDRPGVGQGGGAAGFQDRAHVPVPGGEGLAQLAGGDEAVAIGADGEAEVVGGLAQAGLDRVRAHRPGPGGLDLLRRLEPPVRVGLRHLLDGRLLLQDIGVVPLLGRRVVDGQAQGRARGQDLVGHHVLELHAHPHGDLLEDGDPVHHVDGVGAELGLQLRAVQGVQDLREPVRRRDGLADLDEQGLQVRGIEVLEGSGGLRVPAGEQVVAHQGLVQARHGLGPAHLGLGPGRRRGRVLHRELSHLDLPLGLGELRHRGLPLLDQVDQAHLQAQALAVEGFGLGRHQGLLRLGHGQLRIGARHEAAARGAVGEVIGDRIGHEADHPAHARVVQDGAGFAQVVDVAGELADVLADQLARHVRLEDLPQGRHRGRRPFVPLAPEEVVHVLVELLEGLAALEVLAGVVDHRLPELAQGERGVGLDGEPVVHAHVGGAVAHRDRAPVPELLGHLAVVRLGGAQQLALAADHDAVVRQRHGEALLDAVVLVAELPGQAVGDLGPGLALGVADGEALEDGGAHRLLGDVVRAAGAREEEVHRELVLGVQEPPDVEGGAHLGAGVVLAVARGRDEEVLIEVRVVACEVQVDLLHEFAGVLGEELLLFEVELHDLGQLERALEVAAVVGGTAGGVLRREVPEAGQAHVEAVAQHHHREIVEDEDAALGGLGLDLHVLRHVQSEPVQVHVEVVDPALALERLDLHLHALVAVRGVDVVGRAGELVAGDADVVAPGLGDVAQRDPVAGLQAVGHGEAGLVDQVEAVGRVAEVHDRGIGDEAGQALGILEHLGLDRRKVHARALRLEHPHDRVQEGPELRLAHHQGPGAAGVPAREGPGAPPQAQVLDAVDQVRRQAPLKLGLGQFGLQLLLLVVDPA